MDRAPRLPLWSMLAWLLLPLAASLLAALIAKLISAPARPVRVRLAFHRTSP